MVQAARDSAIDRKRTVGELAPIVKRLALCSKESKHDE